MLTPLIGFSTKPVYSLEKLRVPVRVGDVTVEMEFIVVNTAFPLRRLSLSNTSFITPRGLFCYKVIPFGLKNAGATYQRLVTRMFRSQIGKHVEVYIENMVIKPKQKDSHIKDLKETFEVLKEYKLKLKDRKSVV